MRHKPLAASSHTRAPALSFLLLYIFLFLLAPHRSQAQEAAKSQRAREEVNAATSYGSITGRVVGDDGRPLGDVLVYIYGAYASMSPRGMSTDASGRFQFKDLPAGLYTLRANAPAYVELPDENRNPLEPKYFRPGETAQLTLVKGGVITGTVLDAQGEPLVGANIRAVRVRDALGRRLPSDNTFTGGMPRMTDDRGIYRIYGLLPGSYLVVIGGGSHFYFGRFNFLEADVPTYYPSSTRDTAVEVSVRAGEEVTGVDIRHRGEHGRTISGSVTGAANSTTRFGITVTLTRAGTGFFESQASVLDMSGRRTFSLNGIPDGEYEIIAQGYFEKGDTVASLSRRVTVRGSDVVGLELQLAPLASIAGRIILEPTRDDACPKTGVAVAMQQTLVGVRREDQDKERVQTPPYSSSGNVPNEQGEFVLRNLSGGLFRLGVRPPGDDWYMRSVTVPAAPARAAVAQSKPSEAKTNPTAPGTITVKNGERVSGVSINLAQGAANLQGRVGGQAEGKGAASPSNLRAYLVPQERERADDVLRYAEANVGTDGSFTFTSLAPGRYWIILRSAPQSDILQTPRLLAWDEEARKSLRREAEGGNNTVELKPCQRVTDFTLSNAAK